MVGDDSPMAGIGNWLEEERFSLSITDNKTRIDQLNNVVIAKMIVSIQICFYSNLGNIAFCWIKPRGSAVSLAGHFTN